MQIKFYYWCFKILKDALNFYVLPTVFCYEEKNV